MSSVSSVAAVSGVMEVRVEILLGLAVVVVVELLTFWSWGEEKICDESV